MSFENAPTASKLITAHAYIIKAEEILKDTDIFNYKIENDFYSILEHVNQEITSLYGENKMEENDKIEQILLDFAIACEEEGHLKLRCKVSQLKEFIQDWVEDSFPEGDEDVR